MSDQHEEALSHLLYGIQADGGFVLLTGEVGTGKTTLSRRLIEQLPEQTDFALILNPHLQPIELLQAICDEFHIDPGRYANGSMKALSDALYRFLLHQHAQGRNTLLIVDEAQQLPFSSLEQLRLLTNLETSEAKLLKVVLLGQPELLTRLAQDDLRQLAQRISARFHLGPLTEAQLPDYVRHRLSVAGLARPVFPPATLKCLYRLSGGLPRVINQICDRALLGTYVQTRNEVRVDTLQRAAREVLGPAAAAGSAGRSLQLWLLVALLIGLLGWGAGFGLSLWYRGEVSWPAAWSRETAAPPIMTDAEALALRERLYPWEKMAPADAEVAVLESGSESVALPVLLAEERGAKPTTATSVTAVAHVVEPGITASTRLEVPTPPPAVPPIAAVVDRWPVPADPQLAEVLAYRELFALWGVEYDPRQEPVVCDFAGRQQLGCLTLIKDLQHLAHLNRPAVVTLAHDGARYSAVLKQLNGTHAQLQVGLENYRISRDRLLQVWGGTFTLLWRWPPGYRVPLWPGAEGEEVAWLSRQLRQQRGLPPDQPARRRYDAQLLMQVKAFQQAHDLNVDGVAGPLTLIRLNSLTGQALPRLFSEEANLVVYP
ncbi:ExeA family protein [Marinobacterium weihaiense]|uniref:AAA family ATPase n=1 Tax=Marinobacterium weihaiense TaxID=2851016 RepID=A0ABS6MFV6_9GAMM|nr:ExeA family protein [Marinobacterium weihaiense]MBV0934592.1 AAA family ATPase [Marinobacterium weihaiense]